MFDHQRLKNRRLALNLRPKDIYVILGVTKATYANWESGARVPQEGDIRKLEMMFDVEEDYFIDKTHIVEVFPKLNEQNKRLVEQYAHDLYLEQLENER